MVRPGYKRTEVGEIPEDWEVRPLGRLVTFLDGQRRPVKDSDRAKMQGPIPYYGASGIVDWVNDFLFDEELILLGEDGENILSRNCRLAFRISGKTWVNNHAHVLRPNSDVSIGFLCDYLESLDYASRNSGTAQPKLNRQACEAIPVALPPTTREQSAVATALEDADALVKSLEHLLAKKRAIKQGAMQSLLTGATRLPGFTEPWEVQRLGDVLAVCHGKSQAAVASPDGPYPILASGGRIGWARSFLHGGPSVLIGRKGTIDSPQFMETPFWSVDTLFFTRIFEPHCARFLFYRFLLIEWRRYNEASGVPSLSARTIEAIELLIPPPPEQAAIAEVLADLDADLDATTAKLHKARAIKQGMMQELLTGRIRLV